MSTQAKGAARERQVAERLRSEGWIVKGHGDAHGAADLIAARAGEVRLIQVKANKHGGPWNHFRPVERSAMSEEAAQAGALAVLVWWPPDRKGARFLYEDDWPA